LSVIEETRSFLSGQRGKLQDERAKLVEQRDAITNQIDEIDALLAQLNALGGHPARMRAAPTSRRSGIRDRVLEAVRRNSGTPAEIRKALGIGAGDKGGSQSVSNAISALKRDGKITTAADGTYAAAP
jgi:hypothetical protein